MYNVQQQEDIDYRMGVATEQQNALALSRMTQSDDWAEIDHLVGEGRFVVVALVTAYCRYTDAICGTNRFVESHHATRKQAEAAVSALYAQDRDWDEVSLEIQPRPVPVVSLTDDDLPF